MANNPEFRMKGVRFVIASPAGSRHPLTFLVRLPNGRNMEVLGALHENYVVSEVATELRRLAALLEEAALSVPVVRAS